MALKACPECGGQVSTEALACPHCGMRRPAKKRRGCLSILGILFFLFVIVELIEKGTQSSAPQTAPPQIATPSASPDILSPGTRAVVLQPGMACVNKQDAIDYLNSYSQADSANDTVGKQNAFDAAIAASCHTLIVGQQGLILDNSGFLIVYSQIRLDSDQQAYWVEHESLGPAP